MIEPNDLPIVCIPTGLSDDAAAELVEFLHALTQAIEQHYAGQLLRRQHRLRAQQHAADDPF